MDSCPFLVKKITLAWSYECLITEYLYNQRYTKLCEAPCKVRRLAKSAESDRDPGYSPQAASRLGGCLRGHTIQILDLRRLLVASQTSRTCTDGLEAADLRQRFAADLPAAFNADLAGSMNDLSSRRREEALEEIQDMSTSFLDTTHLPNTSHNFILLRI